MEQFRVQEQKYAAIREKLEYGVYHVVCNLKIEGYTSAEPLAFENRTQGQYRVWQPGEHWGDLFDCGWFHFTGIIPESAKDEHLAVLVDLSAEGLIVDSNGDAVQGMTSATSRNEFPLGLWGKRTIELKDCINQRGEIDFWGDFTCMDIEGQYKNNGRVKEACLASIDDDVRDCFYDWQVCQSLFVGLCENGEPYGEEVGQFMEQAAAILSGEEVEVDAAAGGDTEALMMGRHAYGKAETGLDKAGERISIWPDPETEPTAKRQIWLDKEPVLKAREILAQILSRPSEGCTMDYSSIGHSHLDLLFLWPERETPRKCARTMSTVMKMMDRFPEYKFTLSQAPVYMWLKDQYPALYARMKQRIQEKRLEVVGALYIECDTNLPGGEALVRQLLYGKRYFREEFGQDMKVGFLPDVFGYSAALPQLFVKADVPYFTTNKMSMNDTNRFPRYTFWWYGLDGTKILTHMLPENSYTSASVPQMAIYGEYHYTDKDLCYRGLQLYGLGDGGGGPGYEHMERRRRSRNLKGCPKLEDEFVVDFFQRIEKDSDKYRSWHGELYFERHQGTYTSIAKQKKWNRTLEKDLHILEWLASMADGIDGFCYPRAWLKECWQDVMLYQFHDCLPGSAIDRVYSETQAQYAKRHEEAWKLIEQCKLLLASRMATADCAQPMLVMNPTSFSRTERVERDGRELYVTVAPYEVKVVDFAEAKTVAVEDVRELILENSSIRVVFGSDGTVSGIFDKEQDREILPAGKRGNVLKLYHDENTHWDIEKAYLTREGVQAELTAIRRYNEGNVQKIAMTFTVGESTVTQVASLDNAGKRVDFATEVDWKEEYQMLRVEWPVDVVAETASCEIQFGHVKRPTHQNTTWDQAKFEVCAHKWADMSDRNGGLALLNDCKYGYKIWDGVLDLCLLRSQNCPCEHGDLGKHSFTYSIFPHSRDVWDGDVIRQGYLLNYPLETLKLESATSGECEAKQIIAVLKGTAVIENIKMAEDSDNLIVRLYEAAGGSTVAKLQVEGYRVLGLCNLLEEPVDTGDLTITPEGADVHFHAFEIQSLMLQKLQ